MRYAYVTGVTTDSFVQGVINMITSLDANCFDHTIERICLVTENISKSSRIELENHNIKCVDVSSFNYSGNGRWTSTFTKLNIYNLIEYDKIVWVDADMMIISNLDTLFQKPHMSAVRTRAPYKFDASNDPIYSFNSGLMVVIPNRLEYNEIIASIEIVVDLYNSKGVSKIGDQNVLNEYYADWWQQTEKHLDDGYNVFWGSIDQYVDLGWQIDSTNEKQIKVIHFTGKHKPWNHPTWFWIKTWIRSIRYQHRLPSKVTMALIKQQCDIQMRKNG